MVKMERVFSRPVAGWPLWERLVCFDWGHWFDLLGRGASTPPLGQPSAEWETEA